MIGAYKTCKRCATNHWQQDRIERLEMALRSARQFVAGMYQPSPPGVSSMPQCYYPCGALLHTIDQALGEDAAR